MDVRGIVRLFFIEVNCGSFVLFSDIRLYCIFKCVFEEVCFRVGWFVFDIVWW